MLKTWLTLVLLINFVFSYGEDKVIKEEFYNIKKNNQPILKSRLYLKSGNDLKFELDYFYSSEVLFCKWCFDNEKLLSTVTYYDEDSKLIGGCSFKGKAIKPNENLDSPNFGLTIDTGLIIYCGFEEDMLMIFSLKNYEKGKLNGLCYDFFYDKDNKLQVKSFGKYKNDKMEGVHVGYSEKTGQLKYIQNYKKGVFFGTSIYFDENGRLTDFFNTNAKDKIDGLTLNIEYKDNFIHQINSSLVNNEDCINSIEIQNNKVLYRDYNKKGKLVYEQNNLLGAEKINDLIQYK